MKWLILILLSALPVSALAESQCAWENELWWVCNKVNTDPQYGNSYIKKRVSRWKVINSSVIRFWYEYEFTARNYFSNYSATFDVNCIEGFRVAISATGTENHQAHLEGLKQPTYFAPDSIETKMCEDFKQAKVLHTTK